MRENLIWQSTASQPSALTGLSSSGFWVSCFQLGCTLSGGIYTISLLSYAERTPRLSLLSCSQKCKILCFGINAAEESITVHLRKRRRWWLSAVCIHEGLHHVWPHSAGRAWWFPAAECDYLTSKAVTCHVPVFIRGSDLWHKVTKSGRSSLIWAIGKRRGRHPSASLTTKN